MLSRREEIEARINAFVGSWLDTAPEEWGEDFDIGTFALVFEVVFPPDEDAEAGGSRIGWTCSDSRNWVQAGLFRRAHVEAEAHLHRGFVDDE